MSSRPGSSHNRPSHIPLPAPAFPNGRTSPTTSPLNTPQPLASPTSPRTSFLPSFMRTRSRAATITNRLGAGSPTQENPNPLGNTPTRNGTAARTDGGGVTRSVSTPQATAVTPGIVPQSSYMEASHTNPITPIAEVVPPPVTVSTDSRTYRIRLVPHLESTRSLAFEPVIRDVFPINVQPGMTPSVAAASITSTSAPNRPLINGKLPALLLKIGRYTDKSHLPVPGTATAPQAGFGSGGTLSSNVGGSSAAGVNEFGGVIGGNSGTAGAALAGGSRMPPASLTAVGGGGDTTSNRVAFRSKVVSRVHAEIWCEPGGKFFIRDTASSSGTFLNHIRLSSPNVESRPQQLNDGDTLQLGVDFQGGQDEIYRCVKMRVEVGREWQRAANEFNTNALKQLKALGGAPSSPDVKPKTDQATPSKKTKASVTDCCICLFSVTVCQSLFIAPCSHVFHYKCIRPLLLKHHPGFSCPLCRTFANLEEDVETEDAWEMASRRASVISRRPSNHSIRLPPAETSSSNRTTGPSGQPSTGVVVGEATRSVDDLLAQEGSGRTSEDNGGSTPQGSRSVEGISEPPQLAPAVVPEPDRSGPVEISTTNAIEVDTPHLSSTATPSQPMSIALPILAGWTPSNPAPFEDAQTPMNEMFLSTLAGTGMHQRLEAAAESSGQPIEEDVVAEAEADGEGDVEGEGTSTGSEGQEGVTAQNGVKTRQGDDDGDAEMREGSAVPHEGIREDIDMMFT